ncbi:hypothetical protein T484DRAFT_1758020, partial [Baffinella frigidus]
DPVERQRRLDGYQPLATAKGCVTTTGSPSVKIVKTFELPLTVEEFSSEIVRDAFVVTTVISVPEEAATSMLTDFNSEGVVTSLQSSTGFIAEAPIAPEVVITIAPTPPYIPGGCAVGMSNTTSGCDCLVGYVNNTNAAPGCSACPAGTHTKVITADSVITDAVMIDMLMNKFEIELIATNQTMTETTGFVMMTAEQMQVAKDGARADLIAGGSETLRAGFFQAFESSHMCAKCDANTYSSSAATTCLACQTYSSSVMGSGVCHCEAFFAHAMGGVCTACSNCTTDLTFDVTLAMEDTVFVGAKRDAFKGAVAQALGLKTSNVLIGDVK